MVMKDLEVEVPSLQGPSVYLAHLGAEPKRFALRLAESLRTGGVATWTAFGSRGLKSQMREAGRRGVRFVVILGEDELATGAAQVRDMAEGAQVSVSLDDLAAWLIARL